MISPDNTEYDDVLPLVNRAAIVLEPTETYYEWAKTCPGDSRGVSFEEVRKESMVYLIPEIDAEPDAWLKKNYMDMFEHELFAWYADKEYWPKDRSLQAFKKFFDIRFSSVVLDMGEGEIERGDE